MYILLWEWHRIRHRLHDNAEVSSHGDDAFVASQNGSQCEAGAMEASGSVEAQQQASDKKPTVLQVVHTKADDRRQSHTVVR